MADRDLELSSISPVAICMMANARLFRSAGLRSPLGPLGICRQGPSIDNPAVQFDVDDVTLVGALLQMISGVRLDHFQGGHNDEIRVGVCQERSIRLCAEYLDVVLLHALNIGLRSRLRHVRAVARPARFQTETLPEGHHDGRAVVVIEFPSMAALHGFWNSPEYVPVKKLRQGAAVLDIWAAGGV